MRRTNSEEPIALHAYKDYAEQYVNVNEISPFRLYYERPTLLKLLPGVSGKHVLDAGCGSGWLCEYLISQGADVSGVDVAPEMVKMARCRLGDTANIIEANLGEPLDFAKDAAFDLVVSSLTLHYLRDWRVFFAEIHRILVDDGRLVFSVLHPFNPQAFKKRKEYYATELYDHRCSSGYDSPIDLPLYRRSLTEILRPLGETGFLIEGVVEPTPTEECKKHHPDIHQRLLQCPLFLCVRAVKHCIGGK